MLDLIDDSGYSTVFALRSRHPYIPYRWVSRRNVGGGAFG